MCGIAGVISWAAGHSEDARRALSAMVCAQTHRGPDDEGQEFLDAGDCTVGLGQRRLAIIDLSPMGHQPMRHAASGDWITYNGELYNFKSLRRQLERDGVRFRGNSDTEVMLEALVRWGPQAVERFEGMYAILWYRAARRALVLARDHVGIKPLYVARTPTALLYASEVRAILATGLVERRINRRALGGVLAYGAVQEPDTFFRGIWSFPAGSWQEVSLGALPDKDPAPPVRFWRPPVTEESISPDAAAERLRATLGDAVRDHLVSDVPVGVFLSSGLDSTLVAGLGARHMGNLRTYTVGFADNPDMSESPVAARTAAAFGLPHIDVQITADQALGQARRWFESLDQPSMDGLNTYIVSGAVKQAGITVALSGLGGDEVFCGYPTFEDVPRLMRVMRPARLVPRPVRMLVAHGAAVGRSEAFRQKLTEIAGGDGDLAGLYFQRRRALSTRQLEALGISAAGLGLTVHFQPPEAVADLSEEIDAGHPAAAVSALETRFYTGNMLLRDSDTNGMAHSLEIRVPMFDRRVLDGFMSMPERIRMPRGKADKHLLRAAFPELLRPELLSLKKRGFSIPIRRWMVGPLREMCEGAIGSLAATGLVREAGVRKVWSAFVAEPESPIWSRAFTLVVLGVYIERMRATA